MAKQKTKRQAIQTDIKNAAQKEKRGCIGNLVHQLRTLSLAGWVVLCGGFFVLGQIGQMQQQERAPTQTVQAMTLVAMAADLTATQQIRSTENARLNATSYAGQTATATLWTRTPIPTITYTPSVTNTPTITNTPLPTNTPAAEVAVTRFPTNSVATFYAVSEGARGRSCPQLTCEVVVTLPYGDGLHVIGSASGDAVNGETRWWVAESGNQQVFIHSSLMSRNRPAQQQAAPPVNGSGSTNTGRVPENCDEAVAMGLSAVQAAQYDHLDRDKDGVACYGD